MDSNAARLLLRAGFAPALVLRLVVAHERSIGELSRWYGYLSSLPEVELDVAMLWDAAELQLLAGTGLDDVAREQRRELEREHARMVAALRHADNEATAGWCRVRRAAPLVDERPLEALGGRPSDFDHAFANTSLHTFDEARMPPADDALWQRPFDAATPSLAGGQE